MDLYQTMQSSFQEVIVKRTQGLLRLGAVLSVAAGSFALVGCGNQSTNAETQSVPAPFPVVSVLNIGGIDTLKIVYNSITKTYPASYFKSTILDYPCNNLSLPPVPTALTGQFITAAKVNTITGLPTSGHVAVGVKFSYCALSSFSAGFILKPSPTGNHIFKMLQVPKVHTLSPIPTSPIQATYAVDSITSFAFTSIGKLMMNLSNPSGSTGFYVFKLPPVPASPMGGFQTCVNQVNAGSPIC
jgi:hypothetical protein